MGQTLKSKMKLSIIVVLLAFAQKIEAKPHSPTFFSTVTGRQLQQEAKISKPCDKNRPDCDKCIKKRNSLIGGRDFADREQVDEESLAMDRRGKRTWHLKQHGSKPLQKTRANEDEESFAMDRRGKRTWHLKQHGSKPHQKTRANEGNDLEVMRWELDCLMCTSGCPGWCNPDSDE